MECTLDYYKIRHSVHLFKWFAFLSILAKSSEILSFLHFFPLTLCLGSSFVFRAFFVEEINHPKITVL